MKILPISALLLTTMLMSCDRGKKPDFAGGSNDAVVAHTPAIRAASSQCHVDQNAPFSAGGEVVRLARKEGLPASSNFAMFVAPLAVNTDGAPTSYHPDDFLGKALAINRIDNGIAIRKEGGATVTEKIRAFADWRDSNWSQIPAGYSINWRNVIAADEDGKPCVFKREPDKGYFGSLTALKNGLSASSAGECGRLNQLDQRLIPAIVLRGSKNPLKSFGAKTGDLVVAINPSNGNVVPAVIGDTGDGDRIGEGSVALNMALRGRTKQPKTYQDALELDTFRQDIIVAVLPNTITFLRKRPYTPTNIAERLESWAKQNGYGSTDGLAHAVNGCAPGL